MLRCPMSILQILQRDTSPCLQACLPGPKPTWRAPYGPAANFLPYHSVVKHCKRGHHHPASSRMNRKPSLSITERKQSLESQKKRKKFKTVKVEYANNFTIKPLIDFFNKTFRRDVIIDQKEPENESYQCDESAQEHSDFEPDIRENISGSKLSMEDTLSTSSFISCCSSLDSNFSDSLYQSFDDISFTSDLNEDVFDTDRVCQQFNGSSDDSNLNKEKAYDNFEQNNLHVEQNDSEFTGSILPNVESNNQKCKFDILSKTATLKYSELED